MNHVSNIVDNTLVYFSITPIGSLYCAIGACDAGSQSIIALITVIGDLGKTCLIHLDNKFMPEKVRAYALLKKNEGTGKIKINTWPLALHTLFTAMYVVGMMNPVAGAAIPILTLTHYMFSSKSTLRGYNPIKVYKWARLEASPAIFIYQKIANILSDKSTQYPKMVVSARFAILSITLMTVTYGLLHSPLALAHSVKIL